MFRRIVDAMKEGIGCCSGFNSKGLWVEDGKKYDYGYFDEDKFDENDPSASWHSYDEGSNNEWSSW